MASTFTRFVDAARGVARLSSNWMGWWNNPAPAQPHPEPARRRAPLVGEYSDIPASVLSNWDVPSIKGALDSHELGQFQ